jgi:hypothetical protein
MTISKLSVVENKPVTNKKAEDMKDTYIQLLQEGYKPEEVEKYVKDVQKDPSTQAPKSQGGVPSIGSDADNFKGKQGFRRTKANETFRVEKAMSVEQMVSLSKGTRWDFRDPRMAERYFVDGVYFIYKTGENKPFAAASPKHNILVNRNDEDISGTPEGEEIKRLLPAGKQGSFSAAMDYLAKKEEKKEDLSKNGFPLKSEPKKNSVKSAMEYLAGEDNKQPSKEELEKMPSHQKAKNFSESDFTR